MSMSSETEILKTNEFLRRRKLRLQQVREQSKDVAKKIRQRAKVEKLRQIVDLDSKKGREYLQQQEKLVKRLEQLYAQGVKSVGDSHKKATEESINEVSPEKSDLSKLRGKEAVAELRRKKQEKLDEQKKLLDRKLLAREAANEISREKSSSISNKLLAKSSSSKLTEEANGLTDNVDKKDGSDGDPTKINKNDMATQWDFEELPNEWEPTVPALSLPKDDKESVKDSNNAAESKSDKSKRLDLFALSAEMPSSLRGGIPIVTEERPSIRPSLTLVSEYLQSRALRLRETDTTGTSKKQSDDLHNIKQTIIRSRSSRIEAKSSADKSATVRGVEPNVSKKPSVTMYNHSTRDSRDVPRGDSRLVVRENQTDEDAYSQALKETTNDSSKDKEHQMKLQEIRNKVAMTKQNVEKEYIDTMSFLKSLPKEKCTKHMKHAYMDERRQRILKVSRQQKLQQEFNKIEKECRRNCEKQTTPEKSRTKSKSPAKMDLDENVESRDMQYSWMPVPESDGNLAIHTIPTTVKGSKSGNTVKFSKVDSYHEYRSRHKHTPPTKDTTHHKPKRVVETVIIQNGEDESTDCTSISSDTSSVENLNLGKSNDNVKDQAISEADRIVIYKILDKKVKERKKMKLIDDVAKVLKSMNKEKLSKIVSDDNNNKEVKALNKSADTNIESGPIDQVDEGVYKVVSEKGENITSLYFSDKNQGSQEGRNVYLTEDELKYGRPCCCNKKNTNPQGDKGTNIHCGNGDPCGIRNGNCLGCKCGCASSPRPQEQANRTGACVVQPSAATSTSSFKTATTDKANGALPDGGFIKLIDDDGQEAGKFYIGASGFLKDDAYEVIIQLRKKEAAKREKDKEKSTNANEKKVISKESELIVHNLEEGHESSVNRPDSNTVQLGEASIKSQNKQTHEILPNKESSNVLSQASLHITSIGKNSTKVSTEMDQNSNDGASSVSSNEAAPKMEPTKRFVDKGVHTSFQLSYAIPSHIPKTDSIPRPGTSTYTQTTIDSPNPRPVFIHMSSSTSTAYMSPPEMVLPNFMKRGYDYQGENLRMTDRKGRCDNVKCTRRRCKSHKPKSTPCRKTDSGSRILNTPPNTARETYENSDTCDNEFEWPIRKSHRKCHRCNSITGSDIDVHNHRKSRNVPLHKLSSRNLVMRVTSSTASSFKNKVHNLQPKKLLIKPDLNPVVKEYVNKLLKLNREGIKAIEVAHQECSSVSTPGSSIIEVPRNLNENKSNLDNKISLEQMKNILKEKILEEYVKESTNNNSLQNVCINNNKSSSNIQKIQKKRSVHKVKSLNISKRVFNSKKQTVTRIPNQNSNPNPSTSSPSSVKEVIKPKVTNTTKSRSKSSPTPRQYPTVQPRTKFVTSEVIDDTKLSRPTKSIKSNSSGGSCHNQNRKPQTDCNKMKKFSVPFHKATTTSPDSEIEATRRRQQEEAAMNISTQTSQDLDSEINLMKLAEDKLQNMEKIADLTEKCTKRLSNLAKVLEEVRRNKSLAYSQISTSDTASDSENRSEKYAGVKVVNKDFDPIIDEQDKVDKSYEPVIDLRDKIDSRLSTTASTDQDKEGKLSDSSEYVPFLTNIPKPAEFKLPPAPSESTSYIKSKSSSNSNLDNITGKRREKPPPALSRIHLKHGQDVIPHELSTVVEVDSPMSIKLKNQSSTNTKCEVSDASYRGNNNNNGNTSQKEIDNHITISTNTEQRVNPDLLQSNVSIPKQQIKISSDSSEESKMQMMDLEQFNELMLKPFISIQEFAKQCGDLDALDDGSNVEDIPRDDGINDELSSLHSDGSLPDVIAELLKRNLITEPFKFDTVSNVNSNTVSSESTLSILALSKVRKDKKKSSVVFQNKGNASETSDSLSLSSNPDLENAFKKLGMGWASSTLKKTKERLALSSSTNTSSSSLSQFKLKGLNDQDIPALVTDSVLSTSKTSKKQQEKKSTDTSKNAEQQTSFMNSMTVKDFLTNELAKKITFTNKSHRNNTDDEFVSLLETKMPDEMKNLSQNVREERSTETSAQNNRARTSTPVQIFKSMTYHSSSSSNMSNGLFSNADDLSSVKVTSNSIPNHSTSDKDDLTIPNCSLKMRKGATDSSKSE